MKRNYRPRIEIENKLYVESPSKLLDFLSESFPERSRSAVKSLLTRRQIKVNNVLTTLFDFALKKGDVVDVYSYGQRSFNSNHLVNILYEDDDLLVVDKKCGVLSESKKEGEPSVISEMMEHVHHSGRNNAVYFVTGLEREMSGVMLVAKSQMVQTDLLYYLQQKNTVFTYFAVVEGTIESEKIHLEALLVFDKVLRKTIEGKEDSHAQKAELNGKVLKNNGKYTLVEFTSELNIAHQIRALFALDGYPVAGDKKYGARTNPLGRICVHAHKVDFIQPTTSEKLTFDTGLPADFR